MNKITTIAFDADDTLWVNEPIFTQTRIRLEEIVAPYIPIETLEADLYKFENQNLSLFGYGVKGFMLSMIETALEMTDQRLSGADVQHIIDLGKDMLQHPIEVLPGIIETLEALKDRYELMIITKGDLFDQETKIARSGLAHYFNRVEIVSEKNTGSYQELIDHNGLDINRFVMIGNSLKSDVLPVCKIGGKAIHIPFHETWVHEKVESHETEGFEYLELGDVRELISLMKR
ncbi:MAG: HAD family hydrolase [Roseivirga sp.]|nr:HAD family hydrolase [Roseivirga sp.]